MSDTREVRNQHTALESAAAHGSTSYGKLSPERLRAVLLGAEPTSAESARIFQALSETPLYRLATLSREIGLSYEDLDRRFMALFGTGLKDAQQWNHGGH